MADQSVYSSLVNHSMKKRYIVSLINMKHNTIYMTFMKLLRWKCSHFETVIGLEVHVEFKNGLKNVFSITSAFLEQNLTQIQMLST